jgi:2-polyprenyl-3-methyl-5-hydroxy-6-metoxy-1,4-benzoquinol methylase
MTDQTPPTPGPFNRFGYEWSWYDNVLPESRAQLQRWLGTFTLESLKGLDVLDVGCGMGRNLHWMLDAGARSGTGVDVDDRSLERARRNLEGNPAAKVLRCSAHNLDPRELGTFDVVTCIGVLHHLPAPELALTHMWRCVKPGGTLVLWCYATEGNRALLPVIQAFRAVGSRLPIQLTHALARATTAAIWPAIKLVPWQTSYYRKLKTLSYRNVESIVFDQMLPEIAHYWTRRDMERLLAPLGGPLELEFVQDNSWAARVRKPAP